MKGRIGVSACGRKIRPSSLPGMSALIESAYEESPVNRPKKTEKYGSGLSSEFGVKSSGHQPDAHTPIRRDLRVLFPLFQIFLASLE